MEKCKHCETEINIGDDCYVTRADDYYCEDCIYPTTLENDEDDEESE